MEYNFNTKILNGDIQLGRNEWKIIEVLIKMDGQPINAEKIADYLQANYDHTENIDADSVRVSISRLNKKTGGLIKNKIRVGYYIDEEIKFS